MGIKIEFNCTKCGVKVLDTRFTKEHDEVTLALSPWLSLCTQHEKEFFDSKKLTGHVYESPVIENPVIVEGAVIRPIPQDGFMTTWEKIIKRSENE